MIRARYIMIGGFLGAGKTTSVVRLAERLTGQGLKVGLITNDQGSELVDTAMLRSRGFATEEIPGGCFCCRFNSLVEAAGKLTRDTCPDVFIAEPVGSCTDLVATVTYPLRRMYGDAFSIAPLSVVVDPVRAERILGLADGGGFSPKVVYIYRKQLEEADVIVINKCDALPHERRQSLEQALELEFPQARIMQASARTAEGLDAWFAYITSSDQQARRVMEVDYEVYAEGEALLGWLNATVAIGSERDFDANLLIGQLAQAIQRKLQSTGGEIAHLKMTFNPSEGLGDIAVVNLVRNDFVPELSQSLDGEPRSGQLIINLRAEAAPETLSSVVNDSLADVSKGAAGLCVRMDHQEHFRPGKPTPTHRIADVEAQPQ